ncbi:uncharacterized protein PITG_18283 [Phytophthora infestans T30-4]|uniref:Uncharacterized protein n=1 Tax=Phytophthora infestans (strain T30-4) TaxID=403677 RepID=D0NXS8_PHYIT|nr:uncharacterized protein PITG_18283 [Phytophthora infestans T30-4]EEY67878.1 hypothetical protein PITG_18283 [Phytophthora infestans T30-4]|eukprot:XP_002997903.1 hypothetical protein PITG_18283 [Phytophthora infestans T30-4]
MNRRQPARASKKRPSEEAYSEGSENDGSDASWEDDSTVSNSYSAATWSVEDSSVMIRLSREQVEADVYNPCTRAGVHPTGDSTYFISV